MSEVDFSVLENTIDDFEAITTPETDPHLQLHTPPVVCMLIIFSHSGALS